MAQNYRFSCRQHRIHQRDYAPVRKTAFLSHLYLKTNILPRQARDKHGENRFEYKMAQTICVFSPISTKHSPDPPHKPKRPRPLQEKNAVPFWSVVSLLCLSRACRGKMTVFGRANANMAQKRERFLTCSSQTSQNVGPSYLMHRINHNDHDNDNVAPRHLQS